MRVQRHTNGSVRYDKRRKIWNYLWYDGATRRSKLIGAKQEFPTKAAAWKEVERLQVRAIHDEETIGDTVQDVITRYEAERMPSHKSTARVYRSFLNNHIRPKLGNTLIRDVQPPGGIVTPAVGTFSKIQNSCAVPHALACRVCDVGRRPGHQPQSHLTRPKHRSHAESTQGPESHGGTIPRTAQSAT